MGAITCGAPSLGESPSQSMSHCSLCRASLPLPFMSAHLTGHIDSLYMCPLCSAFITDGKTAFVHHLTKEHPEAPSPSDLVRIQVELSQSWYHFYSLYTIKPSGSKKQPILGRVSLFGPGRSWCPSCVVFFSNTSDQSIISSLPPASLDDFLTHVCTHLAYFRYLCRLCSSNESTEQATSSVRTWLNCTLSYASPIQLRAHLTAHHPFEYQLLAPDTPILTRFMSVGVIERYLVYLHKNAHWWLLSSKDTYTKADIEVIYARDRRELIQERIKQDLEIYCANQAKQFEQLCLAGYKFKVGANEASDSDDSIIEVPVKKQTTTIRRRCENTAALRVSFKKVPETGLWKIDK